MTLKIYGTAKSRAARNYWLIHELGLPFEQVDIVQIYNKTSNEQVTCRDPVFLRINPNGHIPAMDDDGFILWESLAINQHIARKYGGSFGPQDLQEEGLITMWSLWAANECEVNALTVLQHRLSLPADQRDPEKAGAAIEGLRQPFSVLDDMLMKTGYLVGGRLTVADINVAMVINYAKPAPELFEGAPRVKAWFGALTERPAFKAMAKMREG